LQVAQPDLIYTVRSRSIAVFESRKIA
jgi:hypothetical protein